MTVSKSCGLFLLLAAGIGISSPLLAQDKNKVIIDQDCAGPGGTDMQAVLAIVNSPKADVLGITVMTGDAWRDEEVQHTLRLLEIIGRTDIPVVPGAVFPIVNSKESTARWEKLYGKVVYQGAWNYGKPVHGPFEVPPMPEGAPTTKAANEDAAHFLIRMVRQYPHQVTIYAGGPLMNLALAQMIDPESSYKVFHSPWPRIVVTTVDISVKTNMDTSLIAQIAKSTTPAAQYVAKYAQTGYLWDELAAAAWLDPSIITKTTSLYMDISVDHGPSYGDTLVWMPGSQPGLGEQQVVIQEDLDKEKFYSQFVELMTRPTPGAK